MLSGIRCPDRAMEALQHEIEPVFPTVETQITGQGPNSVEQALARRPLLAKPTIRIVYPLQYRVSEVRQDDEGRQQGGQMLLAMAVVVFEMIALGFERVVVFVFYFPAAASRRDRLGYVVFREGMGGGQRVLVDHLALCRRGRELAPIDVQGIVGVAQGPGGGVAIGIELAAGTGPTPANEGVDSAPTFQKGQPFVERGMRFGFADPEKVKSVMQHFLAERFMAVQVIAQNRHPERRIVARPWGEPTLGGIELAVLFRRPILRWHTFRC